MIKSINLFKYLPYSAVVLCLMLVFPRLCAAQSGNAKIGIKNAETASGQYKAGETVKVSIEIFSRQPARLHIRQLSVRLENLETEEKVAEEVLLGRNIQLDAKNGYVLKDKKVWTIPAGTRPGPYGLMLAYELNDGSKETLYSTFFRVNDKELTCFSIGTENYKGMKIFKLDGGMSAEYGVEKSAEVLSAGMSHSWEVNGRGSGPNQVYATPEFLVRSVKRTVEFYDETLGKETVFSTVIIGTGVPSIPYLSRATRAPYLPLHFLVSASTTHELNTIHDYSGKRGYKTYSTLGHDPSVPKDAVGWVKLLTLPPPYIEFLKRHKVRNLIILGATGQTGGEAMARLVTERNDTEQRYKHGDLYLLYPQSGTEGDDAAFKEKLKDFDSIKRDGNLIRIADWESGIIREQVEAFAASARKHTLVNDVRFVTGEEDGDLYKLATYVTAAFAHKNRSLFSSGERPFKGVILNPYLISNPVYESRTGYLPFVYWQGNPADSNVGSMKATVGAALSAYFPGYNMNEMEMWLNSSLNFGAEERARLLAGNLQQLGLSKIKYNDYAVDEIWDPSTGMDAPCEVKTQELLKLSTPATLKTWAGRFSALMPADLEDLSKKFPSIKIENLK